VNFAVGLAPEMETAPRSLVFYSTLLLDSHLKRRVFTRERGGEEVAKTRRKEDLKRENWSGFSSLSRRNEIRLILIIADPCGQLHSRYGTVEE